MCNNCTGGLTSLDNGFGQPTYCEQCVVGLGLAMTSIARRGMLLMEGEAERMAQAQAAGRGDNRFSQMLNQENGKLAVRLAAEYDRLEIIYLSLGGHSGHSVTAAAR